MTTSLSRTREMIAMEAAITTDLAGLLKRVFPQMIEDLKSFVGIADASLQAIQLTPQARQFVDKVVKKNTYLDIAPMSAWVPEGLAVSYTQYLPILQACVDHAATIVDGTMIPYCTFLSRLITNRDEQLQSMAYDYTALEKIRDGLQDANAKCFKKNSNVAQVSLGDVVHRNAEWEPILHAANALLEKMNKVDRKALNKKVEESTHLLDTIIKKLKHDEYTSITPQVVENLSNGAYQVGKELEFFSVTYYRTLSFVEAVNKTITFTTEQLDR